MFSGIIEAQSRLLEHYQSPDILRIVIEKPIHFNDIGLGDSIAVNGICLTVEAQSEGTLQFAIGAETLQVTGWTGADLQKRPFNLERSIKLQARVHGHMVTGHVDGLAKLVRAEGELEASRILVFRMQKHDLMGFLWQKGSVSINGVSLTVNRVDDVHHQIEVCLIPETLKRTNLGLLEINDLVTVEVDQWARAFWRMSQYQKSQSILPGASI